MAILKTEFDLEDYVKTTGNYKFAGKIVSILYSGNGVSYRVMDKDGKTLTFADYELKLAKEEILDSTEKKYLENVIKPFKDRVSNICKLVSGNIDYVLGKKAKCNYKYYILITLNEPYEVISLPSFTDYTMYAGMEECKKYTLEELNMFDKPIKCKKEFDF